MLIPGKQTKSKRIQNKSNDYKNPYSFCKEQNIMITNEPVKMTVMSKKIKMDKLHSKKQSSKDSHTFRNLFRCTMCFVSHFPCSRICAKAKEKIKRIPNTKTNALLTFLEQRHKESNPHLCFKNRRSIMRLIGGANLEEIPKMIRHGIESARKHGIRLVAGVRNNADGNCTFEAVLNNINFRNCFAQKFDLHPNIYRQRWISQLEIDAENHPVLGALFSSEEKKQNWNRLKSPFVYEVPYFGDYVIHGIAKGCKKNILIFNTNPHASESIHVIKASEFNGQVDTEIPVVLCYNQSHYESLHPFSREDIEKN